MHFDTMLEYLSPNIEELGIKFEEFEYRGLPLEI